MSGDKNTPKKTQAKDKELAFWNDVLRRPVFQEGVAAIRSHYGIPKEGISEYIEDEFEFVNDLPHYTDEEGNHRVFEQEMSDLAVRFNIRLPQYFALAAYILYNDLFHTRVSSNIEVIDLVEAWNAQGDEDEDGNVLDVLGNIVDGYPIAICVSAYTTGRDVLDFVKKRYSTEVEPLQGKHRHGIKEARPRKRNPAKQQRDDFIYENRELPRKEIMQLVNDRFGETLGVVDYDLISKVINRRENGQ